MADNQEMNAILRRGPGRLDPPDSSEMPQPEDRPPLDLGQGVRTTTEPVPPSMNDVLRGDRLAAADARADARRQAREAREAATRGTDPAAA